MVSHWIRGGYPGFPPFPTGSLEDTLASHRFPPFPTVSHRFPLDPWRIRWLPTVSYWIRGGYPGFPRFPTRSVNDTLASTVSQFPNGFPTVSESMGSRPHLRKRSFVRTRRPGRARLLSYQMSVTSVFSERSSEELEELVRTIVDENDFLDLCEEAMNKTHFSPRRDEHGQVVDETNTSVSDNAALTFAQRSVRSSMTKKNSIIRSRSDPWQRSDLRNVFLHWFDQLWQWFLRSTEFHRFPNGPQ